MSLTVWLSYVMTVLVLTQAGTIFLWVKWLGVAYLFYLGIKMILSKPKEQLANQISSRMPKLYWQGFITSASNLKAIIFFSALFPQFINKHQGIVLQFFILSITYLIMDGLFLSLYACGARRIGHFLKRKNKRLVRLVKWRSHDFCGRCIGKKAY